MGIWFLKFTGSLILGVSSIVLWTTQNILGYVLGIIGMIIYVLCMHHLFEDYQCVKKSPR